MTTFHVAVQAGGETISTVLWQLHAFAPASSPEADPAEHWYLLDGLAIGWQISTLPPMHEPATGAFQIYDDGQHPDGWLPIALGQPIRINVTITDPTDTDYLIGSLDGRITDLTAVNVKRGGVIYSVVVTDRAGSDLAGDSAPKTIPNTLHGGGDGIAITVAENAYLYMADAVPLELEYQNPIDDNLTPVALPFVKQSRARPFDATNQSVYDVLNLYIAHDIRVYPNRKSLYLQMAQRNFGSEIPGSVLYQLVEYDPTNPWNLELVNVMHWTGALWESVYDTDYYLTGLGMVLEASNLLLDVGEWRMLRQQALNRWELTGTFQRLGGSTIQTVRRSWTDLVREFGANTRSLSSPLYYRDAVAGGAEGYGAIEVLEVLQGEQSQVAKGFGFEAVTIVWDTLTNFQIFAWAKQLWPVQYRQAYGHPLAIVNIPAEWRLARANGPLVMGRLMGCTFRFKAGQLYADLAVRNVPPTTSAGVTFDELAALTPAEPTFDQMAPEVTFDLLSVTRDV